MQDTIRRVNQSLRRAWAPERRVPLLLALPALVIVLLFFGASLQTIISWSLFERTLPTGQLVTGFTLENYSDYLFGRGQRDYWASLLLTFRMAAWVTGLSLLIGFPVAYALNRTTNNWLKAAGFFVLFAPMFVSVIVRSYAWTLIIGDGGFINDALLFLGLRQEPLRMLYQFSGVVIGLVQILLPFMVFPILGVLGQIGVDLKEAARDLGANRWVVLRRVVLPLSAHGVIVGCQLVFAISASAFAAPRIMGGGRVEVLASVIYNDVGLLNWPMAAVSALIMLVLLLTVISSFSLLGRLVYRPKS